MSNQPYESSLIIFNLPATVDFLSDLILIVFPLFLVKTMRMQSTTRFLLKIIFSGSFLTLACSIVSVVFFYTTRMRIDGRLFFVMIAHMQASPSYSSILKSRLMSSRLRSV